MIEVATDLLCEISRADERDVWVDAGQGLSQRLSEVLRRAADVQLDGGGVAAFVLLNLFGDVFVLLGLKQRQEERGIVLLPWVPALRALHDADNLVIAIVPLALNAEVLPDGILVREEEVRKRIVNDSDVLRRIGVVLVDGAPAKQARSNSFKILPSGCWCNGFPIATCRGGGTVARLV